MSRTNLDAATLANSLRAKAGDGSVEWVYEPIQASVLLDIADMLDENAKLHEQVSMWRACREDEAKRCDRADAEVERMSAENAKLRELVKDLNKWLWNGADCTECPFTAKCDLNAAFESDLRSNICIGWSEIHDRMHELGIEVSDA